MEEYINGCYTKYGTRPMIFTEFRVKRQLPNKMWCVLGYINSKKDGFSADVYRDEKLTDLVFMEHGFRTSFTIDNVTSKDWEILFMLTISRCEEMGLL